MRKSKGKLLFTSEKSISWAERFEKPRKVSKKKKTQKEREKEKVRRAERERERERERGEEEEEEEDEDEDEVTAAKSVHDPDSRIFLQLHTFFFFFQI